MEIKADTLGRSSSTGVVEEFLKCPSCECKLRNWEVKEHFEQEMERLRQLQLKVVNEAINEISQQSASNGGSDERRNPRTVFQRVQRNRQSRLKQRTRKRLPPLTEHPCPVCNINFPQDEIQKHTEQCLRRSNGAANGRDGSSSNEEDDVDEYEEYEWAGQKRIRVSSLLQGGYAAHGIGQPLTNHNSISGSSLQQGDNPTDEDEDLNVDEDDTHIYGPAQYGEVDVIPTTNENDSESADVTNYVRLLITGGRSETTTNAGTGVSAVSVADKAITARVTQANISSSESSTSTVTRDGQHYQQIIESLKSKLRNYENQVQNKFKCLICLDDYRNPAISVSCWHVHCEECWLRSLGARKLCPQCNLITTPKDLRRIYM